MAVKKVRHRYVEEQIVKVFTFGLNPNFTLSDFVHQELVHEVRAWKDLDDRFILPITGFYLSDDMQEALLVSPWKEGGNLRDHLKKHDSTPLQRLWFVSHLSPIWIS